ncbi:MAG: hypothetical protein ICV84_19535 [Flavisolibacter sp.]|nr:hypothetical protein [Flavisolibacter sp.]
MRERLLIISAVLLFSTIINGQDTYLGFIATETNIAAEEQRTSSAAMYTSEDESILLNPNVHKKQLSKHALQAIGRRTDHQLHFIIHFKKEQLHGIWQSFYDNAQQCDSGRIEKGLPEGEWKTWYPNGQLKTVRNYSADKYHYIKADLKRDHPKYQRYRITHYAQAHKNIKQHFQPNYQKHQNIHQLTALLDKIHHNTNTAEGDSYVPPFNSCIHHGLFINYDEKGAAIDSGYYVNGLKNGLWLESVNEGAVRAVGYYDHGRKVKQWKFYNTAGRLLYTDLYKQNGTKSRHYF